VAKKRLHIETNLLLSTFQWLIIT